ncbi:MAG: outer membrane protein assembly factor [Flavobacteriaceae bacterium]|nr:MAG: outer membrane protein assembly factor [Flavobacteriaceae bacterium]
MVKGITIFLLLLSFNMFGQDNVVAEVLIQGNKRTKSSFVKKIIQVKEGFALDSVLLKEDIVLLKRLPSISNATFKVYYEEKDFKGVKVIYTLEENFTLIPYANLFTSSNDDFAYRIGLQEFNVLGRNIISGVFYQKDIYSSYGVNLRIPYLFGRKWGLTLNYSNLTTQEPVFFNSATADYKYNNESFEILALHEFNTANGVAFGLNFFTEDYSYLFGITSAEVPQQLKVNKYLYKLIYDYDRINYHYQYLSGFRSRLNLQYVHSMDENLPDFVIGFNDFMHYSRHGERGNWASRLRLGMASNVKTPFAPFTVDNNINIRGVGNTIDRGTAAIVLNTEFRYSLVDKDWFVLQGNVFVDAGTWRNPGGTLEDFLDQENLRVYPGIGLRFMHKRIFNAIFRIDYGYGITKNASKGIVFGIGQYF